ncbi:MAG: alanine:cation symporter family protein, partial [Bacteroidota bacterium]
MKNLLVLGIITFIYLNSFSQLINNAENNPAELSYKYSVANHTDKINDGSISIRVSGGTLPYTYKWSEQSISQTSHTGSNLAEGQTYKVTITDATGKTVTGEFVVEPKSADEHINSVFLPVVNAISNFLMADIFAMLNLYDPVIRDSAGNALLHPNGDEQKMAIPLVVVWLILGALYFTIRMKLINFRGVRHAIQLIMGKFDDPNDKGEVSHFQALTTALSATVGLGNIAGVAIAIAIGGPGATFWMIIAGLLGMASKFTECTLGVKYRNINEQGEVSGG